MFAYDYHLRVIYGANYRSRLPSIINQSNFKLNVRVTSQPLLFSRFRHSDTILGVFQISVGGLVPTYLLLC